MEKLFEEIREKVGDLYSKFFNELPTGIVIYITDDGELASPVEFTVGDDDYPEYYHWLKGTKFPVEDDHWVRCVQLVEDDELSDIGWRCYPVRDGAINLNLWEVLWGEYKAGHFYKSGEEGPDLKLYDD